MSMNAARPMPSLIPESAPFSPEQRAGSTACSPACSAPGGRDAVVGRSGCRAYAGVLGTPAGDKDDGAPWHDPAMPIGDRMKLAEGRPLPRRMMAAMAQQDAANAVTIAMTMPPRSFGSKEKRLNLCVPGGKDTARMLKNLYAELGEPPRRRRRGSARRRQRRRCRPRPAARATIRLIATFLARTRLNKDGSEKETWHIEFDLAGKRARLYGRRFVRHLSRQRSGLVTRCIAALGAPPISPSAAAPCATC